MEIDFLLRAGDDVVPIEVKSENAASRSIRTLIEGEHYLSVRWGVKLVNGNVGFERNLLTIPQWCAFLVPRLVKDFARTVV